MARYDPNMNKLIVKLLLSLGIALLAASQAFASYVVIRNMSGYPGMLSFKGGVILVIPDGQCKQQLHDSSGYLKITSVNVYHRLGTYATCTFHSGSKDIAAGKGMLISVPEHSCLYYENDPDCSKKLLCERDGMRFDTGQLVRMRDCVMPFDH